MRDDEVDLEVLERIAEESERTKDDPFPEGAMFHAPQSIGPVSIRSGSIRTSTTLCSESQRRRIFPHRPWFGRGSCSVLSRSLPLVLPCRKSDQHTQRLFPTRTASTSAPVASE